MAPRTIDMHLIQTVPFANLNRDDLGNAKTLTFGGAVRTRVSSQCWKRATREHMEEAMASEKHDQTLRTRRLPVCISDILVGKGWERAEADLAALVALRGYLKTKDPSTGGLRETSVMFFLTQSQIEEIADLVESVRDLVATVRDPRTSAGTKAQEAAQTKAMSAIDRQITQIVAKPKGMVPVFGRMLVEMKDGGGVDSAVQVAHAFTVNEIASELDYFTAVDDVSGTTDEGDEVGGAGHLGRSEFTSGTYYRFVTVDLDTLQRNCGDVETAEVLAAQFLESFALSMPSSKTTATAPQTRPDLIVTQVRNGAPLSWASAFESPVTRPHDGGGLLSTAVKRLGQHVDAVRDAYDDAPVWGGHLTTVAGAETKAFGERTSGGVAGLIRATMAAATANDAPESAVA